jgi:hypothetical protein
MRNKVERSLLPESVLNGGFPEPPECEPVRVIAARHAACGEATRVRLPETVPARAVRRLRCARCEQAFATERVEEIGVEEPGAATVPPASPPPSPPRSKLPNLPALPKLNPESRTWRLASIPIAAVLVVGGLLLLQGGGDDEPSPDELSGAAANGPAEAETPAPAPPSTGGAQGDGSNASGKTKLVRGSSYSLALPAGWERVDPTGGATFAAVAADGGADVTLWIEENPELDFPTFINQSLGQLETLAGSATVVERVPAPTPEATVVVLAADSPPGQPTYEVTLRVADPYRYYLATSVQPDASAEAVEGAELVAGSFTPEAGG